MQDFRRDWRRWSAVERLVAAALLALVLIGAPTALALGTHSF
jgi:hypothetical protein